MRFQNALMLIPLALLVACDRPDESHDHGDAMAAEHAGDTTAATAMVQEPRQPVVTSEVAYGPATGFYAQPEDSAGATAGLIVIHEWWGLNGNIEAMARRFAGEGYRVLAVDLYGGEVAETSDAAQRLAGSVRGDAETAVSNLAQAYTYLTSRGAERVGVVGWCMGGYFSLQAALALPTQLDAAVIYYGNVDATVEQLRTLEMPVRGFFGEEDGSIPVESVRLFEQRLREAGVSAEVTLYPGAGHAFANPTGNNYEEGPAQDSWQKTLAFLAEHLKGT